MSKFVHNEIRGHGLVHHMMCAAVDNTRLYMNASASRMCPLRRGTCIIHLGRQNSEDRDPAQGVSSPFSEKTKWCVHNFYFICIRIAS